MKVRMPLPSLELQLIFRKPIITAVGRRRQKVVFQSLNVLDVLKNSVQEIQPGFLF
jgi:hypothetical protein